MLKDEGELVILWTVTACYIVTVALWGGLANFVVRNFMDSDRLLHRYCSSLGRACQLCSS